MTGRNKRKIQEWDPTKSDSDDLDYGEEASPRPRTQGRSRKSKSAYNNPRKRRRETYGDSDDEIIEDSDEISEEEDFATSSDEEQERNPRTGRSVRSVAKKPVKYEESDGSVVEESEDNDTSAPERRNPPTREKQSLIVKLKVALPTEEGNTRTGRGLRRAATPQTHSGVRARRSSRISNDDREPLVALTDSGRHEVVTRAGTATPEPQRYRPHQASTGMKKPPSAIMEVSQEESQPRAADEETNVDMIMGNVAAPDEDIVVHGDTQEDFDAKEGSDAEAIAQDSGDDNGEDEDDGPRAVSGRALRQRRKASTPISQQTGTGRRTLRNRKTGVEQSSDFEPEPEGEGDLDEDVSDSDDLQKSNRGRSSNEDSQSGRRSARRNTKGNTGRSRSARQPSDDEELDPEEIADEAAELDEDNRRNRRSRNRPAARSEIAFEPNLRQRSKKPDYRIMRPELFLPIEDDDAPPPATMTPQRNRRGGGGAMSRTLFSTFGPFGGGGGLPPVFGGAGPPAIGAGVDSDSSDDEARGAQQGIGGAVGMTPTSAFPKPFVPQTHNNEALQGPGGGPPGLGKVKDKKALADADPLGIDPNVSFDGVGGLDEQIDRLKEMVALPLLYPEVFQRFHVTPPRGVLFHGPPGTGKTLLARALASSVSSHGKKVTFYMRKGADALSKWVGEAEKQLRLLFEEARKNQPSIIFFDEIDGLAPVRSSKQEQIHASIVATLLALMDGMDGRGQVIVIGATNRPDSVDPALRRPGRFDREFYFPLPDEKARRAIIDIHTKGWDPPLQDAFKDSLAEVTRGYGGADLRALCTEAALNAVQGTYPQIYKSNQKLLIDPSKIKVLAKDFMISVNKIVPSSERSAASGATPLKKDIEPLLREPLMKVLHLVDQAVPRRKKTTALDEAMYDDRDDEKGFERETLQRQFEAARIFRPRLLISGRPGMGQVYLGAALLAKLEGFHVQNFDLATLLKDSSRSPEAAIVQQFEEVKRHKPSVIYLPNVDVWYQTLGDSAVRTFAGLLRSLQPTEPILLLGVMDREAHLKDPTDAQMLRDLFGYSIKNQFVLDRPNSTARKAYFGSIIDLVKTPPTEFPEQGDRKLRVLAELPLAPSEPGPQGPTKAELKAQKKKDRQTLNLLKLHIQTVMDQIKLKYKKFRLPPIDEAYISYLYDEQDPNMLTTDLSEEQRQQQQLFRPYELDKDEKGVLGLREVATGKFYYNLEIVTIEKRLSNGYYKRPKDFLADIKRLAKDAKTLGDQDRLLKGNEMFANVEVDMTTLEQQQPALAAECEAVFAREQQREQEMLEKLRDAERRGETITRLPSNVPPAETSNSTTDASGPVVLGQPIPGRELLPIPGLGDPPRAQKQHPSTTTNGSDPSHQTNGSSTSNRPDEDVDMPDSQAEHHTSHGHAWGSATENASEPHTQGQARSQKSAHTQLAQGSQVEQYQNSASTTTSGQKTSDKSNRSSGPYSVNTQLSNGVRPSYGPDFSDLGPAIGGSQLPDTQEPHDPSSQSQISVSSQPPMAPPATARQTSISALLNDTNGGHSPDPFLTGSARMILDPDSIKSLHDELCEKSSGMSVEQLEQTHASLMRVIWEHRGQYNRNLLIMSLQHAFNDTVNDIEEMQTILDPSQSDAPPFALASAARR